MVRASASGGAVLAGMPSVVQHERSGEPERQLIAYLKGSISPYRSSRISISSTRSSRSAFGSSPLSLR